MRRTPRPRRAQAIRKPHVSKLPIPTKAIQLGKMKESKKVIQEAVDFLNKDNKDERILVKIARNMGDALHSLMILKYYRSKYPKAKIAFLTQKSYASPFLLNTDISSSGLFLLPNNLTPQERLKLWPIIKNNKDIDHKIIPAINPFQAVHKSNAWSHPNIADQYLVNAGIKLEEVKDRRYIIKLSEQEKDWAVAFFKNKGINPNNCFILEYHSYSHPVMLKKSNFEELLRKLPQEVKGIAVAGEKEGLPAGYIDARGISWTQTVALANLVPKMVGCGSGITMLCAGAENQPKIFEVGVPESVTMKSCGYADSVSITGDLSIANIVNKFMGK